MHRFVFQRGTLTVTFTLILTLILILALTLTLTLAPILYTLHFNPKVRAVPLQGGECRVDRADHLCQGPRPRFVC